MYVRQLSPAIKDMEKIIGWHNQNYPCDLQVIASIWETAQSLSRLPNRGRKGEVEGTREILVPRLPYSGLHIGAEEMSAGTAYIIIGILFSTIRFWAAFGK